MTGTSVQHLTDLLEPVVKSLGCELWGLEFHRGSGKRGTLRVYIDKDPSVDLGDCERVSRQVSSVLDVEDPIHGEYVLEVSSPGMDRPLFKREQFQQYVGAKIKIKLRTAFEGRRQFSGSLVGLEQEDVVLLVDDHEYLLPFESIEKANVVPTFPANKKPKGQKQKNQGEMRTTNGSASSKKTSK